jgi:hypothetical protein
VGLITLGICQSLLASSLLPKLTFITSFLALVYSIAPGFFVDAMTTSGAALSVVAADAGNGGILTASVGGSGGGDSVGSAVLHRFVARVTAAVTRDAVAEARSASSFKFDSTQATRLYLSQQLRRSAARTVVDFAPGLRRLQRAQAMASAARRDKNATRAAATAAVARKNEDEAFATMLAPYRRASFNRKKVFLAAGDDDVDSNNDNNDDESLTRSNNALTGTEQMTYANRTYFACAAAGIAPVRAFGRVPALLGGAVDGGDGDDATDVSVDNDGDGDRLFLRAWQSQLDAVTFTRAYVCSAIAFCEIDDGALNFDR